MTSYIDMQIFKYGWKCRESYARSGIEGIGNNDEILRLNEKHIEEGLDHKYLRAFTNYRNSISFES